MGGNPYKFPGISQIREADWRARGQTAGARKNPLKKTGKSTHEPSTLLLEHDHYNTPVDAIVDSTHSQIFLQDEGLLVAKSY